MSTVTAPDDIYADIAQRLRRGQSPEQLMKVGERTGWWTDDDVDWVFDGHAGPRPVEPSEEPPAAEAITVSRSTTVHLREDPATGESQLVRTDVVDGQPAESTVVPPEHRDVVRYVSEVAGPELQELGRLSAANRSDCVPVLAGFAAGQLKREATASVALDGDTQVVGGAYTAAQPRSAPDGPYVAVLRIDQLYVDHSYQRPLDTGRVRRMADTWNPRLLGLLDVSDRGPDTEPVNRYAIVNGQHRAAAAARVGVTHVACNVHERLDVAGEARLMHELDRTTKKLSGHDQWRARRGAGDQDVLQVEAIAARHGLRIDNGLTDGVLRAYGAAEKLLRAGGEQLLDNTLGVLRAAYGLAAAAWQAPLVTGVGQVLRDHPALDVDRLTKALTETTPTQLRSTATSVREIDGGSLADAMARAITGAYNRTPGAGPRLTGGRG